MKILVIWHHNPGQNPGGFLPRAFEDLGHTAHLCTNANEASGRSDDYGDFPRWKPRIDIALTPAEEAAFNERRLRDMTEKSSYLLPWSWIRDKWHALEQSPPDFVFITEGGLAVGGEKPDGWKDIPVGFWALDCGRGADHGMRRAFIAGATVIFVGSRWYMPYFQIRRHRTTRICDKLAVSGSYFDRVYWLPTCADDEVFKRYDEEKRYDVLFLGTTGLRWKVPGTQEWDLFGPPTYDEGGSAVWDRDFKYTADITNYGEWRQRATLMKFLMEEKAFKFHLRPSLHGEAYARELARGRIVWNCQGAYEATHNGTTNRPFQAAAVGSVPMTNDSDEIADLFVPGREVMTYPLSHCPWHSLFEWLDYGLMRDRILDLLGDQKRQDDIREAAVARTQKSHLAVHRAQRVVGCIKGTADPWRLG